MNPVQRKKQFEIKLTALTPVFIGSGETLDPLAYTIQKDHYTRKISLHHYNLERWVEDHFEDKAFMDLLNNDNFHDMRSYIQRDLRSGGGNDPAKGSLRKYSTASRTLSPDEGQEMLKDFNSELKKTATDKLMQIDKALTNPLTGRMIIPGSSLKGAIRTAIIDHLYPDSTPNSMYEINHRLGGIADNAFKALKISDFELLQNQGQVVRAKEKKRNHEQEGTPKNSCEASFSVISGHGDSSVFHSTMQIGFNEFSDQKIVISQGTIKEEFDLKRLFKIVTEFYKKRFDDEIEKFYNKPHFGQTRSALEQIIQRIEKIDTNKEMLLRVGHYSHIECMTITNNRPQPRKSKDGNPMGPGSTRTLADGIYPFGWVLVSLSMPEALKDYRKALASNTDPTLSTDEEKAEPPEAEFSLDDFLSEIRSLTNWGAMRNFAKNQLEALAKEHYSLAIKTEMQTVFDGFELSKKKRKETPDLKKTWQSELNGWFQRFEE